MRPDKALILLMIGLFFSAIAACREKPPQGFLGSGTLEATEVKVSSMVMGTIFELFKEEGDRVTTGDLLARIDVEKLELQRRQIEASFKEIDAREIAARAAIAQAENNIKNLRLKHKRIKSLYEKGSAPEQQYDDIHTQLDLALNQLTSAKAQLPLLEARRQELQASINLLNRQIADGRVVSPLQGMIIDKYVEPGEVAVIGGSLYKIADLEHFRMNIYLAEMDLDKVTPGKAVEVRVDALETPLAGQVVWISPEAEFTPKNIQTRQARAELVYAVKITIDDPGRSLKIGMPAEVYSAD